MPLRNPTDWWRRTRLRSLALALIVAGMAIGGVWFAITPGTMQFLSIPAGQLVLLLLPFALAFAVHWLALRQEKLDRDFSVWEGR
jgi:quinol-cytochrome oxidoreductase complex cytochrome b subunit